MNSIAGAHDGGVGVMTGCVRCGAGTWAATRSRFGPLCLGCLYRTRTTGVVTPPVRDRDAAPRPRLKPQKAQKPTRVCVCRYDEACDVCYAAKEAAMDARA